MDRVVVVGAGLAGLQTVVALRSRGYAGVLRLVGAEGAPPYDRPPLSKAVLLGEADSSTLDADWAALGVEPALATAATGLRPGVLETEAGDEPWDAVVLATGAEPVRLPGDGSALVLRTSADSLALRGRLRPGARLVVVGAGWISAEVATAARRAGAAVTVVEALDAPLAAALPPEVGARTTPWWAGVDLRLGARVSAVEPDAVHLDGGERVPADTVLVAVGARPASGWLAGSDLALTAAGAVAVDGRLRASLPGVWAVGDLMAWDSARFGTRLHVQHWDTALHSPGAAAADLLGADEPYDPVPYFWSEQWGRMLQYVGHHPAGDRLVWREDGERWAAFWLAGDRLVAAVTVDRPRDLLQARRLIAAGGSVDAGLLADPGVAVKAAVV